jgi:predicted NAD-dependent protein-ADP-ribosyltransferase YbiA (DUF1768 family)
MDILSTGTYPLNKLSNFAAHRFEVDGVLCASMEGFLQSLPYKDQEEQRLVCRLTGWTAKKRSNRDWQKTGMLYWKGKALRRDGVDYQILLDRAYEALAKVEDFRKALLATGDENLTHEIGHTVYTETILTTKEFCSRLMSIRDRIRAGNL